jgi:hypothetical protein
MMMGTRQMEHELMRLAFMTRVASASLSVT